MEHNNNQSLEGGLFSALPTEMLAKLFSNIELTDLIVISATCNYWRVNAWSFAVLYGPTALHDLIKHSIDNAEFAYIDDIFAEPDPHFVQVARQKRMNLFNTMFQRIEQSAMKLDTFTLEYVEGFDETKEHFFSAVEHYPAFLNQITSLRVNHFCMDDLGRVLKLATSLQTLDFHVVSEEEEIWFGILQRHYDIAKCQNLTSLTIGGAKMRFFHFSKLGTSLESLTLQNCAFDLGNSYYFQSLLEKLTYLGILDCTLITSTIYTNGTFRFKPLPRLFTRLQTLELRRTLKGSSGYELDPAFIQELLPKIRVIGECACPDPNDRLQTSAGYII